MISFKQFFTEAGFKSFIFLPDKAPYGFVIWPDGTFKPVKSMYGHATAAGGEDELNDIIKKGGIRVSQPIGDDYFGEIVRSAVKPQAKKTALDIANFYNVELHYGQYMVEAAGAYTLHSSFADLPQTPPHGFWVTKDGKFIVIPYIWGHDEAINALYPSIANGKVGSQLQMNALKAGFIRMAKIGDTYGLTYHPMYSSTGAKKTAKDIAEFYNMGVQDDFEGL